MKVYFLIAFAVLTATAMADAIEGTSFNFGGAQYTFYPGQTAVTFPQAQVFCLLKGQVLAMFDLKSQLLNASEYISEGGGVWTNYRTDPVAMFASFGNNTKHPWQEEFAMLNAPERTLSDANKCGLLSLVSQQAGIVPTDCLTKKAALCLLDSTMSTLPTIPTRNNQTTVNATATDATSSVGMTSLQESMSNQTSNAPSTNSTSSGNKTEPIQLTVEGKTFTLYPKGMLFGLWSEASAFCTAHDDQVPAVFTTYSQLKTVVTQLNTQSFWVGYTTDDKGQAVSLDSSAPWISDFAKFSIYPKGMCGAATVMLGTKVSINWQPCLARRTVLCSAKNPTLPTLNDQATVDATATDTTTAQN